MIFYDEVPYYSGTRVVISYDAITTGTVSITTPPSNWSGFWMESEPALPRFGWYNIFRPVTPPQASPAPLLMAHKPRRGQSRRCRADARRWKRRRFLHALRSSA